MNKKPTHGSSLSGRDRIRHCTGLLPTVPKNLRVQEENSRAHPFT